MVLKKSFWAIRCLIWQIQFSHEMICSPEVKGLHCLVGHTRTGRVTVKNKQGPWMDRHQRDLLKCRKVWLL